MDRIKYIDGIKGVSAIMVFFTHYRMMGLFYPNSFFCENPVIRLIMSGNLAVHIFLIMSGFCIALSVSKKMQYNIKGLQTLVLMRYLRLALPISFVLISVSALYIGGAFPPHEWVLEFGASDSVVEAYQGLSLIKLPFAILLSPIGVHYGWLFPIWMLKYIFLGTFLIVILRIGTNGLNYKLRLFWNIFFICVFGFISEYYLSVVFGNLLFELKANNTCNLKFQRKFKEMMAILLLTLGIFLFMFISKNLNFVVAIFLVSSVFMSGVLQKLFSLKVFVWLGSISFSLYLIHWPLICSYSLWINDFFVSLPYINAIFRFSTTVLLLIFLSFLYMKYVENKVCSVLMSFLQNKLM